MAVKTLLLVLVVVSVAALSAGAPCTFVEDQLEYDLSRLAVQDHYKTEWLGHTDKVIYLSLCHPLRNAPSGCAGNDTGVCIVDVSGAGPPEVAVANAGRVSPEGPEIPQGQLMVEYVMGDGDPCPHAPGETYRTYVNFLCAHTPEEETGPVVMSSSRCQLQIAWMTQSACPRRLDAVGDTSCSLPFPSSDHTLHLQTLRSEGFYSSASAQPSGKYEVNVCGPVVGGSCRGEDVAVCYTPEGGSPRAVATTRDTRVWWEGNHTVVLAYGASDHGRDVEVRFLCRRGTARTTVDFVKQNDTAVIFGVRTSAVCSPVPAPRCVLDDFAGNVYDLRPLHRSQGNWEVVRPATDGKEVLYLINICGPVNPTTLYTCPSGLIGACIAGLGKDAAYSLGLLTSEPTINIEDGSITVLYTGGDPCKGGEHSHSSKINLICSSVEHGPALREETDTCEHVFDWHTPVACARHLAVGTDCRVDDPLYGNVYDLNPLRSIHEDYRVSGDDEEYLINVCGSLVSSCDGRNGVAGACEVARDGQFNAGLYSDQITFNDGTLLMKYTNGSGGCRGNDTRSSQIMFLCDHEASGRDGPAFFHRDGCSNSFFWKTKYACPPFHVVDCTLYTADGTMYDLWELSSSNSNLEYFTNEKKFVLNVCRSVVHQKGSRCAYRAGACIVDRTHHNASVNIGEVQSGPYLEDGKLLMRYAGGQQCPGTSRLYQTLVEFKCDHEETYPIPQLIAEENCTYYFEIRSAAACPVLPPVGENCTVTSPGGYTFDLGPLRRKTDYVVEGRDGATLTLNVCGALNDPQCPGEGVGICSKGSSAGLANANLHYLREHLSLTYVGGEQCSGGKRRSTIITFVCGAENATEGPVLVVDDDDSCMYFVTWHTELACDKRIPCFVDTWTHRIDLSPLIRSAGNYEAENPQNPKEKFYLNVCRPLNPIVGVNCRPGSAVCVSSSEEGKKPLSLGHPNVMPAWDGSGGAQVMYVHGAKCPADPGYDSSSKIFFVCDPSAGKGNPAFKEVTHDCQYQFEWRTSAACDMQFKEEDAGPQCQIRYDKAKANVDLKPLHRPGGYRVEFGNGTFVVNVCGTACGASGSCSSDGDSYGLSNKSDLVWQKDWLMLKYFDGTPCVGFKKVQKSTTIFFKCDMSAGFGSPVADDLMERLQCEAVFEWKTNVTCMEAIYGTQNTPAGTPSPHGTAGQNGTSENSPRDEIPTSSSVAVPVVATLLSVTLVMAVAGLVLFKTRRGNHLVAATHKLFGIHSPRSQLENSTLLGATSSRRVFRADDSDDDLLRV